MFGESKRMYWVSAISAVCLVETFCVKSQTNIASLHLSIRCGISACWSEGGGGRCSGGRTVGAIAQQLLKWHGTKNWTILVFHAFQKMIYYQDNRQLVVFHQLISKICSSNWMTSPTKSGWKHQKLFQLPAPRCFSWCWNRQCDIKKAHDLIIHKSCHVFSTTPEW